MRTAPRHTRRAVADTVLLKQARAAVEKYGPAFPRHAASPATRLEEYIATVPVIVRVRVTDSIKHHARLLAKARAKADAMRVMREAGFWGEQGRQELKDRLAHEAKRRLKLRIQSLRARLLDRDIDRLLGEEG